MPIFCDSGVQSLWVTKPPLHSGGCAFIPEVQPGSLIALRGSVGGKPGAGADAWPIKNGVRRWGLFGSGQQAAGVTAVWIDASARRWGET